MHIRQGIFSVGQETWYQDADDCDKNSIHFLGILENKDLAAYLRVIEPGIKHEEASIGRVSVLKEYRRKGSDAKAVAYIEVQNEGKSSWGVGMHANTVIAGLLSVISGLNKITSS